MTTRIGPYELLSTLGEGGMGRVYRARDTRLGRVVAIKFLRHRPGADTQRQLRFLREAKAEAALSHPNIATVLDVGETEVNDPEFNPIDVSEDRSGKVPYLVLEFVPGQDLRTMTREGPLPFGELLRIGRQIVAGLKAAHLAGIVHRDLKPGNIRVTPDGLVKILDFGLARFAPESAPTSDDLHEFATSDGAVLGTVPYLAPEQAVGDPVDARADLFSLGVLLYELAAGELPFRGVGTADRLRAVLRDDPPPLAARAPEVPLRFAELVHRLLEKDASRRPRDAAEVETELQSIGHDMAVAETSITSTSANDLRSARSSHSTLTATRHRAFRHRTLLLVLIAVTMVAGGLYFYLDERSVARAEALVTQGNRAEELPDPQAPRIAAGLYERATRIQPNLVSAWTALSKALVEAYRSDRVPELLERAGVAADRAYALDPQSVESRIARARIDRLRGHAQQAIKMLESIPKRGAALYDLEDELAEAWDAAGDAAKAEEHHLGAIAARPNYWRAWNALGAFRVKSSNYSGARAAFQKAVSLAPPGVPLPAENAAAVLALEGKYTESLAAYDKIQGPEVSADAASNRGTVYYFNGRFSDAEHSFREAIRISPREPAYHRNLADTLLRLNRPDDARTEYAEALRLVDILLKQNPQDITLLLQRSLYLARAGHCSEALEFTAKLQSEPRRERHRLGSPGAAIRALRRTGPGLGPVEEGDRSRLPTGTAARRGRAGSPARQSRFRAPHQHHRRELRWPGAGLSTNVMSTRNGGSRVT